MYTSIFLFNSNFNFPHFKCHLYLVQVFKSRRVLETDGCSFCDATCFTDDSWTEFGRIIIERGDLENQIDVEGYHYIKDGRRH